MRNTETRRTYTGTVVSTSNDKTITVQIETYRSHKLYGKRVKYSNKLRAHDEESKAKVGDIVTIMSSRPYSKTKKFRLLEIKESK